MSTTVAGGETPEQVEENGPAFVQSLLFEEERRLIVEVAPSFVDVASDTR